MGENPCYGCGKEVDKAAGVRCSMCEEVICPCGVCGCVEIYKPEHVCKEVTYTNKEFTCLCPFTNLPDYATVEIWMSPRSNVPELKSLKLWFNKFRNQKIGHEMLAHLLCGFFVRQFNPLSVHVKCVFSPRGGIETTTEHRGGKP